MRLNDPLSFGSQVGAIKIKVHNPLPQRIVPIGVSLVDCDDLACGCIIGVHTRCGCVGSDIYSTAADGCILDFNRSAFFLRGCATGQRHAEKEHH